MTGRILDWRSLPISDTAPFGTLPPCVLCGQPAMCLSPLGKPCHKTCAERWLDEHGGCFDCSGTGRNSLRGRIVGGACLACNGSGKQPAAAGELGPTPYRVLVTGSRSWTDTHRITAVLDQLYAAHGDRLRIVHGACPKGADAIADSWCRRNGVTAERHPANWSTDGRRAGYERNAAMVATGPDACVAFIRYGSPGASNCAELAERAGIRTDRQEIPPPADVLADVHAGRYGVIAKSERIVIFEDDRQVRHCAEEDIIAALIAGRYVVERSDGYTTTCRLGNAIRTVTPLRLTARGRRCLQAPSTGAPHTTVQKRQSELDREERGVS